MPFIADRLPLKATVSPEKHFDIGQVKLHLLQNHPAEDAVALSKSPAGAGQVKHE
jgi:hypothetical protein